MTVGERPLVYAPRTTVALPRHRLRGWTVKGYGISATRDRPPAEVIDAARVAADLTLPQAYDGEPSHAFTVVHEDADGCYVVVAWWSRNKVILHSRTWLSGWDDPAAWRPAPAHATACVWELAAIAAERDAWVRHVASPPAPDFAAYLAATHSGVF
ncbi:MULTISPECIES: hypothetical protein [unclassified Nonomuraea]|uniref:hypothetical protein n=1 Tax=unclassified Nonomuraea TaxID=2593643 RepID=UPI0035C0629D